MKPSEKLAFFLVFANFVGFLFGVYYYMPQLAASPPLTWLLIIDCPLYVLLFSLVLGFELLGRPLPDLLKLLTAVGLIKYGLWTVAVVLLHFNFFFSIDPLIYGIILPTHVIMAAEAILVVRILRPTLRDTIFAAVFFLANDVSDYVYGTLPWVPNTFVPQLFAASLIASVLLPAIVYRFRRLT